MTGDHSGHGDGDSHGSCCSQHHQTAVLAKDPVCGMNVDPHTAKHIAMVEGQFYYFCCAGCRSKFLNDPARYLSPKPAVPVAENATYTCPMHPEVRQQGPGSCPICGMALEAELVSTDTGPTPNLPT